MAAKRTKFEQFPELAEANARLGQIEGDLASIRAQRAEIQSTIRNPQRGPLADMARAVANGEAVDFSAGPGAKLHELADREAVLSMAANLAQQTVASIRGKASAEIWRNLLPEHRKISGKVASALSALATAMADDVAFRDECARNGLGWQGGDSFRFPPMGVVETLSHVRAQEKEITGYASGEVDAQPAPPKADPPKATPAPAPEPEAAELVWE